MHRVGWQNGGTGWQMSFEHMVCVGCQCGDPGWQMAFVHMVC